MAQCSINSKGLRSGSIFAILGQENVMSSDHPTSTPYDSPSLIHQMYGDYFLEYASYVILERAVPHALDGLKPVQRRILHSMERMDDGRYNKVANIVGDTMKYHPHGDASIGSALVTMGQKNLLIDTQGNWGNILTGDSAAASRYIEARLSPFAKEVLFSPKVTDWKLSYDGRNKEPVALPAKFPLLLAQGALGIAVGMSCLILPHNFNELIDAAIAHLREQEFTLYPDFLTGGLLDASNYQDGTGASRLRCRARFDTETKRCIRIVEIPYGTTTESIIQSIEAAAERGKIKITRIEDNTAATADILVYYPADTDVDKLCQSLYAFTDCQVSISPKSVVIIENKPHFIGVSEILKHNVEATKETLRRELDVQLRELQETWMQLSLEKIFIENRIYQVLEESNSWEESLREIGVQLAPHVVDLLRPVTRDDIVRLTEIRIRKIAKYEVHDALKQIARLEAAIEKTQKNLANLIRYTIRWFESLKKRYGAHWPRRTELCEFESVSRAQAAVENETFYIDEEGFAGYGVKKGEPYDKCSTMSDILTIDQRGVLTVRRIQEKFYLGKKHLYIAVLRASDDTIFNLIYRDGKEGITYAKRFRLGGFTREKEYPLTQGTAGSRIFHFSAHKTEQESAAILVNVYLKNQVRALRKPLQFDFAKLRIKGRVALGNIVTKNPVERIGRVPAPKPLVETPSPEPSASAEPPVEVARPPHDIPAQEESVSRDESLFSITHDYEATHDALPPAPPSKKKGNKGDDLFSELDEPS